MYYKFLIFEYYEKLQKERPSDVVVLYQNRTDHTFNYYDRYRGDGYFRSIRCNRMTLKEFNILSDHNKYDLTFTQGTFIEYWINGNQRFALYSVFLFYVEVEYDANENKIKNLLSFEDGNILNKYLFFRKSRK